MKNFVKEYGLDAFKALAYNYSRNFEHSCILDSCQLNTGVNGGNYEFLVAYGAEQYWDKYEFFEKEIDDVHDWVFGILGYDVKNNFEELKSENKAIIETPEVSFFIPEILITVDKMENVSIVKGTLSADFWNQKSSKSALEVDKPTSSVSKEYYLKKINEIHELIRCGEVYELNYCVPYSHSFTAFDPISFHLDLLEKSPVPMGSYYNVGHLHLCGASMERYLMKNKSKVLSQPIKGTIRKGISAQEDAELVKQLELSEKDRAENVMIVDLVRNDLARISESGSVNVDELFGIYSYLQVHQMISTVSATLKDDTSIAKIVRSTFPMGSMTGAPKIAAMEYIEDLEDFKRGWYSGSIGYIDPERNMDFNVIIRSVICDEEQQVINYNAGGAITIDSDPEEEWKEVQLKTKAIRELLD